MKSGGVLLRLARSGCMGHAYILTGACEDAKEREAVLVAAFFGCENASSAPCFQCVSCKSFLRGTHPDLHIIESQNGEVRLHEEITVEQIRDLRAVLSVKPWQSSRRVVVIRNAHLINREAQSAFLKTLEEPAGGTLFLLLVRNSELLLATIRSRAQTVAVEALPATREKDGQNEAGAALKALARASYAERIKTAKELAENPHRARALVRLWIAFGRESMLQQLREYREEGSVDAQGAKRRRLRRAFAALNRMLEVAQDLERTNVNTRLALEHILFAL